MSRSSVATPSAPYCAPPRMATPLCTYEKSPKPRHSMPVSKTMGWKRATSSMNSPPVLHRVKFRKVVGPLRIKRLPPPIRPLPSAVR